MNFRQLLIVSIALSFFCSMMPASIAQSSSYMEQLETAFYDPVHQVKFTVPFGWVAAPVEGGYMLQSPSIDGYILLLFTHYTTTKEAKEAIGIHVNEENHGIDLMRNSELVKLGKRSIMASYQGKLAWKEARCQIIAITSYHGGMNIIAGGFQIEDAVIAKKKARELSKSLKFSPTQFARSEKF